jgi:hypothetical protein
MMLSVPTHFLAGVKSDDPNRKAVPSGHRLRASLPANYPLSIVNKFCGDLLLGVQYSN